MAMRVNGTHPTSATGRGEGRTLDPYQPVPFSQLKPSDEALAFLIEGAFSLPRGDLTMLYGDSGIGKSWFAYQLMVAVAMGKHFLGCVAQQAPVMLLDFENRRDEIWRRIANVASALGVEPEELDGRLHLLSLGASGTGLRDCIDKVMPQVERCLPGLIVVDAWHKAFGGNLVDSDAVTEASRVLHRLQGDDRAVLVLHHVSTSGTRGARAGQVPDPAGNRYIRHRCRVAYHLSEPAQGSDTCSLTVVKENYGISKEPKLLARAKSDGLVLFELAKPGFQVDVSSVPPQSPSEPGFDLNGFVLNAIRDGGGKEWEPIIKTRLQELKGVSERTARRHLKSAVEALTSTGQLTTKPEGRSNWLILDGATDIGTDTRNEAAD